MKSDLQASLTASFCTSVGCADDEVEKANISEGTNTQSSASRLSVSNISKIPFAIHAGCHWRAEIRDRGDWRGNMQAASFPVSGFTSSGLLVDGMSDCRVSIITTS